MTTYLDNEVLHSSHIASQRSVVAQAAALAAFATPGHFDELRGSASQVLKPDGQLTYVWSRFFENLGPGGLRDLTRRMHSLQRQVRDNGITYNVYADANGPQRPWSVDVFPLILAPQEWPRIEAGVRQRAQLLNGIMADVYGPQSLLRKGLLPSALVHGHPGYLRAMHGAVPVGGTYLHIAAFDLARDAQGRWWVVSQRTQSPSGLGYLLENRLLVSRLFPQAFSQMHVQRLAATYHALLNNLRRMCAMNAATGQAGQDARIVLLTPGPYNETYFEHAYLARYLGLPLVEGNDLTVRDQRLFLKTLRGLQPVHGILKRLDDEFLDPLELRSDSHLGVPGLLQAIRAGHVLVANAPGSAFLESAALLGFLPALSQHLLGQALMLPSLPTWWCGEDAAMQDVLPRLAHSVIRPTWPQQGMNGAVLGRTLSPSELRGWSQRIACQGDAFTVQAHQPLSQMPTWHGVRRQQPSPSRSASGGGSSSIVPRAVMLRVFAICDGPQSWRVLPGGLARIAGDGREMTSMQRGGSSADVWVLTQGAVDTTTLLAPQQAAPAVTQRSHQVSSRAAENLFWLGRYTERTENTIRLARLALQSLNGEGQSSSSLRDWIHAVAQEQGMIAADTSAAVSARTSQTLEQALIDGLVDAEHTTSVGYNLCGLRNAASTVRERLSQEHWSFVVRAQTECFQALGAGESSGRKSTQEVLRTLERLNGHTAAITGAQTDRMTRDDGWRLLSTGRQLERLGFLADAMARGFETGAVFDEGGFEAIVALFDSTITFHAHYQMRRDVAALLDLLVLDRDNPRSLAWVTQTLRGRIARIEEAAGASAEPLLQGTVPDIGQLTLSMLCEQDAKGGYAVLQKYLQQCVDGAWQLSDRLATRYFTHSADARHYSVGA